MLTDIWHVLVSSSNVFLNICLPICGIWTIWAFLVRFYATFPTQMSLQVSFPSVNLATLMTMMRFWCHHFRVLLSAEDLTPDYSPFIFMEPRIRRREAVSCKVCKNLKSNKLMEMHYVTCQQCNSKLSYMSIYSTQHTKYKYTADSCFLGCLAM